jgi:hypothetical protein
MYIKEDRLVLWFGMLSTSVEEMDSCVGVPESIDFKRWMFTTMINNTLYGCRTLRLAKGYVHIVEQYIPHSNQGKPNSPDLHSPEENMRHYLTLGAGKMNHWESEGKHALLSVTSSNVVMMYVSSRGLHGQALSWHWQSAEVDRFETVTVQHELE